MGIDFKSNVPKEQEDEAIVKHNTRVGVLLFFIYVAIYAGFMGISAFKPQIMSVPFFMGLNLSVAYGFFLIVAALILALIYMALCRKTAQGGQSS
jgi:uncharacterized membrane protein (DUF485 family)